MLRRTPRAPVADDAEARQQVRISALECLLDPDRDRVRFQEVGHDGRDIGRPGDEALPRLRERLEQLVDL